MPTSLHTEPPPEDFIPWDPLKQDLAQHGMPVFDDQSVPPPAPDAVFHCFPSLPAELQIKIWQEAASVPRIGLMKPDSAGKRSAERSTIPGSVPALLHVNRQSRDVCGAIYQNRFQIQGENDVWETYVFADHDILSLDKLGLEDLAARMQPRNEELDPLPPVSPSDLRSEALDMDAFREALSPNLRDYIIQAHLQPPSLRGFRGDLESVKWLVLHQSRAEELWPGISSDTEFLANLSRAFPVTADIHRYDKHYKHPAFAAQLSKAGVADLPERYHCHPVPCPQHPGLCDRKRPAIALARSPLSLGTWLTDVYDKSQGLPHLLFLPAYGPPDRELDLVVWCFRQPRFRAEPLPETASEEERAVEACAAAAQARVNGAVYQVAEVYPSHDACDYYCPWREDDSGDEDGDDGPQTGEPAKTPGCWRCERGRPFLTSHQWLAPLPYVRTH